MSDTYYGYDELCQFIVNRWREQADTWMSSGGGNRMIPENEYWSLAQFLGVHSRVLARWRETGLPTYEADEIATRLGVHPIPIWGWSWVTNAELERDVEA